MTTKMTEDAYIFRGDLMALMCAKDCLRQITTENNPHIVDAEYNKVMFRIMEWESAMFAEIDIE